MGTTTKRKRCPQCKYLKDETLFRFRSGNRSHQRDSWCNDCRNQYTREWKKGNPDWERQYKEKNLDRIGLANRKSYIKRTYGLTWEQFEALIEKQKGTCAVCRTRPVSTEIRRRGENRASTVDHDHVTGKVRGVLCTPCNLLLGYAQDDPVILQQAIDYLKEA